MAARSIAKGDGVRDLVRRADEFLEAHKDKPKGAGYALLKETADALRRLTKVQQCAQQLSFMVNADVSRQLVTVTPTNVPTNVPPAPGDVWTFEVFWRERPRRGGTDSRRDAKTAWDAAIKRGNNPEQIIRGVIAYRERCEREGKIGTEYVMQARRFLRSEEYQNQLSMSHDTPPDTDPKTAAINRRAAGRATAMASAFLRQPSKQ
jgi:hypothetical protein